MFGLPSRIVVFDTEYTSWEGARERNWNGPNEYREIVQIGAVRVDARSPEFRELDSLLLYVKPVKNPKLSDYFIKLTGIDQKTIAEKGMSLGAAVETFFKWTDGDRCVCWGHDGLDIENNCDLAELSFPFPPSRFQDLHELFSARGVAAERYMSSTLTEAFGKESPYRGHDGLNDARTLAEALRLLALAK